MRLATTSAGSESIAVAGELIGFIVPSKSTGSFDFWAFPRAHLAAVHCRFDVRLEFVWPTSTVIVICDQAPSLLQSILSGKINCLRAPEELRPGKTLERRDFTGFHEAAATVETGNRLTRWTVGTNNQHQAVVNLIQVVEVVDSEGEPEPKADSKSPGTLPKSI